VLALLKEFADQAKHSQLQGTPRAWKVTGDSARIGVVPVWPALITVLRRDGGIPLAEPGPLALLKRRNIRLAQTSEAWPILLETQRGSLGEGGRYCQNFKHSPAWDVRCGE